VRPIISAISGLPPLFLLTLTLSVIAGPPVEGSLAEDLPSIRDTIVAGPWQHLGPFSMGPREGVIGTTADPSGLRPVPGDRYPSTLVQGGHVGWEPARPDSSGWTDVEFEGVLWDTIMDIYGYAGLVNGAYAYCEIETQTECRALVEAERIGSFWLNGDLLPGDPYGHGYMRVPVILRQGVNTVTVTLSGYGDHRFKLRLLPVPAPIMTIDDYTLPDLVRGESGRLWMGIPVLNTTESRPERIRVTVGDGRYIGRTERTFRGPEALCIKKVPVEIEVIALPDSGDALDLPIRVTAGNSAFADTVSLRLREPGQSVRRTFISGIDSSCQYYAVLPPSDYEPGTTYSLILTLHGANVRAENQVDAYKPKTWAYVVAPTNRRPYGFDWQDWGRLDALEVLAIAKQTLPVDTNRVYLTGHSMGGHGAWHVGLTHPDLFAAMAPAAGWTCFELYIPWFLQKAYIHGEPVERGIRELALRQDWPHTFLENARNLPVFILQGGADDNVPPFHARLMARGLNEIEYQYRYKEDPGCGHWYRIDSLDVACVDDPDLIGFFEDKVRNPVPREIVFKTVSPAQSRRAYWLEVLELENLYREAEVEARVRADTIRIETRNVERLAVTLSRDLIPSGRATIEIGGRYLQLSFRDRKVVHLSRRAGAFRLGENLKPGFDKRPERYGPIKQAMFSPFVLVYGTLGDAAATDLLASLARQEAFAWWRRGNGFVEVLPDTEVTHALIAGCNLILFGGPGENSITRRIDRSLPIRCAEGKLILEDKTLSGRGLAAKFVYPNPLEPEKLVVVNQGTDREGLQALSLMRTIYAGAGLPDYLVFDQEVGKKGWGGIVAAGFFDTSWQPDPRLMYYRGE
jgi:pimeloyl-ACP methyl ester carboxylesterase